MHACICAYGWRDVHVYMHVYNAYMDGWMYVRIYVYVQYMYACMDGWMDACHFLKLPTSHEMFIILLFILRGSSNGPAPLLTLFFPPLQ